MEVSNDLKVLTKHINIILEDNGLNERMFVTVTFKKEVDGLYHKLVCSSINLITLEEKIVCGFSTKLKLETPQDVIDEVLDEINSNLYTSILLSTKYQPQILDVKEKWKLN